MMILTNTSAENAFDPSLFPSAATPVQLEEQENHTVHSNAKEESVGVQRGEDSITISAEAVSALEEDGNSSKADEKKGHSDSEDKGADGQEPNEDEQKMVEELKARDQEVRIHEQAHIAAGGQYVRGGATFSYQSGPDGRKYAIGGNVNIDTSPVSGDPDATIRKMQTVRAAALAPAEPSGQDRSVAAQANQAMMQAQAQKTEVAAEEKDQAKEEKEAKEAETSENQKKPAEIATPIQEPKAPTETAEKTNSSKKDSPAEPVQTAESLTKQVVQPKDSEEEPSAPKAPKAPKTQVQHSAPSAYTQRLEMPGSTIDFAA